MPSMLTTVVARLFMAGSRRSACASREDRERALELPGLLMDSSLNFLPVESGKVRRDALAVGAHPEDVVLELAWGDLALFEGLGALAKRRDALAKDLRLAAPLQRPQEGDGRPAQRTGVSRHADDGSKADAVTFVQLLPSRRSSDVGQVDQERGMVTESVASDPTPPAPDVRGVFQAREQGRVHEGLIDPEAV